jgi:cellulose synthase/poly-beta-1,6-N-acetylglucosamine synthase-like glycosyltransferase
LDRLRRPLHPAGREERSWRAILAPLDAPAGETPTPLWADPPRPRADTRPAASPLSPREAAFAFGLRSLVIGRASHRTDLRLAVALAATTPADCLDASFALNDAVAPAEYVRLAHGGERPRPPFGDGAYYEAIARWLGAPYDGGEDLARRFGRERPHAMVRETGAVIRFVSNGRALVAISPAPEWLPELARAICRNPALLDRLLVVPPQAIVGALGLDGPTAVRGRIEPLHDVPAAESADVVITPVQRITAGAAVGALTAAFAVVPAVAVPVATTVLTLILVAYAVSRGLAAFTAVERSQPRRPLRTAELPVYTVLVPLYKEDAGMAHLVRSLKRLDYPAEKLDIQFLVEADDAITQKAIRREATTLRCRMTICPPGVPRTKPRALNVGLRQARGELVTIYDAEDRPDPRQLRVAAETFAAAPPDLAAVQARLSIDHLDDNWLTTMFAVEYACLFDHVMPMLAKRRLLILLGGTSNHFRRRALVAVGGWDPYNVTEDADLSIRLARRGYRIAMIDSDTWEEAPIAIGAWLKQRSRWFKGYIQTWLVHNRRPLATVRELGLANAAVMHLSIVGALAAGVAHIAFLVQLLFAAVGLVPVFSGAFWLVAVQAGAAAIGYGMSVTLGVRSVVKNGAVRIRRRELVYLPVYWFLMGCAVLIAVHDIVRRPHHWRKTTHGVAVRPARTARTAAAGGAIASAAARKALLRPGRDAA